MTSHAPNLHRPVSGPHPAEGMPAGIDAVRAGVQQLFSEIPDFGAVVPAGLTNPHYDLKNTEAHALAEKWWPEFASYMQLRRGGAGEVGTIDLMRQGKYSMSGSAQGKSDPEADRIRSRNLAFTMAESMLQKQNEPRPGEINQELFDLFFMMPRESLGEDMTRAEAAAVFLLALAYPGSAVRRHIDAQRESHRKAA